MPDRRRFIAIRIPVPESGSNQRGDRDHERLPLVDFVVVTLTPAELIKSKRCTPGCIAATTKVSRCGCPCAGRFHGLVATADVTALIDARRSGRHRLDDLEMINHAAA